MSLTATATWTAGSAEPAEEVLLAIDDAQSGSASPLLVTLRPGSSSFTYAVPTDRIGTRLVRVSATTDSGAYGPFERSISVTAPPKAALAVSWPSARAVAINKRMVVSGRVVHAGAKGRRVRLQHATGRGWETLAAQKAGARGRFSFSIPTDWTTVHRLRVAVPATSTRRGHFDARLPLRVKPGYRASGPQRAWSLLGKARWDPCRPIRYRVHLAQAPSGALTDVHEAVRRVGQATGLRFVYAGRTSQVPWKTTTRSWLPDEVMVRGGDLLIGWANERQVPNLAGNVIGMGGGSYIIGQDARGFGRILAGQVALDASEPLRAGFRSPGLDRGQILMHEIGHAVGLGHAFVHGQVMGYEPLKVSRFGAGDLEGFRRVGRSAGCFRDTEMHASARLAPGEPPGYTPRPVLDSFKASDDSHADHDH